MELQHQMHSENREWRNFQKKWQEEYKSQGLRYGQAFYNHFNLHKCNFVGDMKKAMDKLYNTENLQVALSIILNNFQFN